MDRNLITEMDEKRLDELLTYAPDYSEQNSGNIWRLFLEKSAVKHRSGKRILLAAAIAAVAVALSGIALAVTIGFDFGGIFNSFFNNPSVENKIEVGRTVAANGLEITFVSTVFDGNMAYALVEIEDTEGDRLIEPIRVIGGNSDNSYHLYNLGKTIFSDSGKKASLPLTMNFIEPVNLGDTIELNIDAVLSGVRYIESEALGFDIAAYATSSESITADEWSDAASGGVEMPGTAGFTGDSPPDGLSYRDDGMPVIPLLELDKMEVGIGGIDWAVITNAGVTDGRLHLQIRLTDTYNMDYNYGWLHLLDGEGNTIQSFHDVSMGDYREMVFDVGDADLQTIRLAVTGYHYDYVIPGPWSVSFVADQKMPKETVTFTPIDSPYFKTIELTYSSLATSLWIPLKDEDDMEGSGYTRIVGDYISSFESPYLTLDDGSVVALGIQSMMVDPTIASADYRSEYFDISMLRSITFCGEEYIIGQAPPHD